jgi:hypothetical protein
VRDPAHQPASSWHISAWGKLDFDAAQLAKAVHEHLEQARGLGGLGDSVGEDVAGSGLVIKVADARS